MTPKSSKTSKIDPGDPLDNYLHYWWLISPKLYRYSPILGSMLDPKSDNKSI